MVAEAEHEEERDEEDDERDYFAEKFRDDGLAALFKIKIPQITIDQRDHHRRAEKDERGADMIAPAKIEPINPGRGIEGKGEGEELEENSERARRRAA